MTLQLIDTHCHLSFKAFDDSWIEAVKRARDKDIQMICVGAAKATSEKSIAIAEGGDDPAHDEEAGRGVFASIGCHPTHTDEEFDYDWFSQAADNPKVLAIGETGIDHFHIDESQRDVVLKKQEDLLRQHLKIAKEKDLPVILHSRDGKHGQGGESYGHLLRIIKEFGYFNCVLHCFGGSWEIAKKVLDLGLMLSFTGIVTFKNASNDLRDVVSHIPIDRFMIETDSPYLAPEPFRGKQNEPAFVEYVAKGIAEIRNVPYDEIARATTENAKRFFRI